MWRLLIEPTVDSVCVMAFSPIEHHALISEEIHISSAADSYMANLKDVIYDNPLLLSDFKSITILFPSDRFLAIPDIANDTTATEAFRKIYPEGNSGARSELLIDKIQSMNVNIVYEIPADLLGFLRRTFNNPNIFHTLTPLAAYFQAKHPNRPEGKMMVNLRGNRCDIVILGNGSPLLINSYPTADAIDAVYHIMAARQKFQLPASQEIILAGTPEQRSAVTPHLRRFVRYVMPAIFPSTMFRAGRASLRTPFEMVIQPMTQSGKS